MNDGSPFKYKFERIGWAGKGSQHCTYCPKAPGEVCSVNCHSNYDRLQAERSAEGVIVTDEP